MSKAASIAARNRHGWAVAKQAGRIASPSKGDFGISKKFGGNWVCEGGRVYHDGKYWIAECIYQFSGGGQNWDNDLYN